MKFGVELVSVNIRPFEPSDATPARDRHCPKCGRLIAEFEKYCGHYKLPVTIFEPDGRVRVLGIL